jgi:hypothetical protein
MKILLTLTHPSGVQVKGPFGYFGGETVPNSGIEPGGDFGIFIRRSKCLIYTNFTQRIV